MTAQRAAYLAAYLERFGRMPSATPEFRTASHPCTCCESAR